MPNSPIQRLLKAAARCPHPPPHTPPLPIQNQILAHWLHAPFPNDPSLDLLRAAMVCACALMILTAALSYRWLDQISGADFLAPDVTLNIALNP